MCPWGQNAPKLTKQDYAAYFDFPQEPPNNSLQIQTDGLNRYNEVDVTDHSSKTAHDIVHRKYEKKSMHLPKNHPKVKEIYTTIWDKS